MQKGMIVSFSHSNYMINSYGTEKFIRELSASVRDEGYHHLHFFSFYHQYGNMAVGVNYDDHFKGIYDYSLIKDIVAWYVKKESVPLIAIHVQHLLNHNLTLIEDFITYYKVPTYVFAHDFFLVCNHYKLIDSDENFCGISMPCSEKCCSCDNQKEGTSHFAKMVQFLKNIDDYLVSIVAPSDYVADGLRGIFAEQANKIVVRPHMQHDGHWARPLLKGKIKIAYAGLQVADKGYLAWKRIVESMGQNSDYEFYYFGTGNDKIDGVKNVYVSVAEQGEDAMSRALKEYGIDVALMWTMCPETYSFVYYELSVCGIFILTNQNSGNVCKEVQSNKNGHVFESLETCIETLSDAARTKDMINAYRTNIEAFCPEQIRKNTSLTEVLRVYVMNKIHVNPETVKPCKKIIKTMAYILKHRKKL